MVIDKRGGHNRKKINENFFKGWSPQMAYVLGFIYADGAIEDCRESSRTCYLSLTNNNLDILKAMACAMSSNHTISIRTNRSIKIHGKEYMCRDSYCLRIGSKEIFTDLTKLGLYPRKSLTIQLPIVPRQYFSYFLRGYFDGDGCINIENAKKRLNIIFTSGSKVFIDQIDVELQKFIKGLKGSISFGCGAYRLRYNFRNANAVARFIYDDIKSAPYLNYKYVKYSRYLKLR